LFPVRILKPRKGPGRSQEKSCGGAARATAELISTSGLIDVTSNRVATAIKTRIPPAKAEKKKKPCTYSPQVK
jgi:hypothetical protein